MAVHLKRMKSIIRRLVQDTSGNELMEAAAIFPLLFMVFLGIFWAGQAFSMYGTITRAAQEGARAGAAPYCSTCSTANPPALARTAVQNAMAASNLNINNAQAPSPAPTFTSCNANPPNCDAGATNICVQWPVQITNTPATGNSVVCGVVVSFQYPFKTYLPFTSINQTTILLNAQARVRIETQ